MWQQIYKITVIFTTKFCFLHNRYKTLRKIYCFSAYLITSQYILIFFFKSSFNCFQGCCNIFRYFQRILRPRMFYISFLCRFSSVQEGWKIWNCSAISIKNNFSKNMQKSIGSTYSLKKNFQQLPLPITRYFKFNMRKTSKS